MVVVKKMLYLVAGLMACMLMITCTQIEFDNPDEGEPIITLLGPHPYLLNVMDNYTEPGATAFDIVDGETIDITSDIEIDASDVNTTTPGESTVFYTVTDNDGKTATEERIVKVQEPVGDDKAKPVITLKGDNPEIVYVDQTYNDPGATAWDENDGDITADIKLYDNTIIITSRPDTFTIWYMVQDKAGNVARATRMVIVQEGVIIDTIPPLITLLGGNPMLVIVGGTYGEPGATATDNVDGDLTDEIVIDNSDVNTSKIGSYTVTYTVSDSSGNEAQAERIVEVREEDAIPPVITLSGDNPLTLYVGESYNEPGATAIDNLDGNLTNKITIDKSDIDTSKAGRYTVVYTVCDLAGNEGRKERIVIVEKDALPPVITLEGKNPVHLDLGDQYNEAGATAIDNVDGDLTDKITIDNSEVNTAVVGKYFVKYSVSDASGNGANKKRRVNVWQEGTADRLPPVITLNGPVSLNLGTGYTYTEFGATAWDSVDGDLTDKITISGDVYTGLGGTYIVTYTVDDDAGNEGKALRTVNVEHDKVKPVITLLGANPMNLLLHVDTTYIEPGATATDNVDGDITDKIVITGKVNTNVEGSYNFKYTVSDTAGNKATATRRVNVIYDTIPPVITVLGPSPMNITVGYPYNEPGATATDNIDTDLKIIIDDSEVNTSAAGTYKVTYNVSDRAGNSAEEKERTVNVNE